MKYEDLDHDTRAIIDCLCQNTGRTKEQSILVLVEYGMISMIAAICPPHKRDERTKKVFDAVNADPGFIKTAETYQKTWE